MASESVVAFNKNGRLPSNGGVDRVTVMPLMDSKRKEEARADVQFGKSGLRLPMQRYKRDRSQYYGYGSVIVCPSGSIYID